ncbi:MAG TPA: type II secretion system F family protein [Terriglobia bacterium]|nr:type II secretion system F family protein [Terriglobia bacterium]
MADYVCKFATAGGRMMSQIEQAASESEVRQRLLAQGYYVFSVHPKEALKERLRSLNAGKIKADDFLIFNQQFLTLSKSGLPLQKSLDLLARQTRSDALRAALQGVQENVRGGAMISEAFEAVSRFPKIYTATLRAGERSGNLDRVLAQYVTYQKIRRGFRKKFVAALIYPAILLVFLTILVTFVVGFIVPQFATLYASLEVALPLPTQIMIAISLALKRIAVIIFAAIVAGIFSVRAAFRSLSVRLKWDGLKYKLPVVGKLLLKFSVAEFARTLSTLLQGGIPVVAAFEITKESVSSPLLALAIAQAQKEVTGGRSLSASLRMSGFFPPIALDMVEVGETTGALPAMLEGLAEFFEEDVAIDLATLVALVDPLMIGSIAIVVAFVLIAFYLPLFSLAGQIGSH